MLVTLLALITGFPVDLTGTGAGIVLTRRLSLAGEVPGVIVRSRLTRRIPERVFTWVFSILGFSLGARLLVG